MLEFHSTSSHRGRRLVDQVLGYQNQLVGLMKTSRYVGVLVLGLAGSIAIGNDINSMGFTTSYAGGTVSGPEILPGEIAQSLAGQMVPPLPGQATPPLPGQIVKALPGQLIQPLPGQIVQSLPGQLLPNSPRYFDLIQRARTPVR